MERSDENFPMRDVENGHAGPVFTALVGLTHSVLAIYVGLVIGQQHVVIAIQQGMDEWCKEPRVTMGKFAT
jgi:hypothetical protein